MILISIHASSSLLKLPSIPVLWLLHHLPFLPIHYPVCSMLLPILPFNFDFLLTFKIFYFESMLLSVFGRKFWFDSIVHVTDCFAMNFPILPLCFYVPFIIDCFQKLIILDEDPVPIRFLVFNLPNVFPRFAHFIWKTPRNFLNVLL